MVVVGGCHYPPDYQFIQYPLWSSPHGGLFHEPPQFYHDYAEAQRQRQRQSQSQSQRSSRSRPADDAEDFFRRFCGGGGFFGFEAREDTPPEPDYPYSVFGLPRCSSDDDVKRAYREAVLKAHPDNGGDAELFRRVREAWEHFVTFCRV